MGAIPLSVWESVLPFVIRELRRWLEPRRSEACLQELPLKWVIVQHSLGFRAPEVAASGSKNAHNANRPLMIPAAQRMERIGWKIPEMALYNIPVVGGLIAGILVGAFWQVLVIFGLHWGLVPLAMMNYGQLGYDFILSPYFTASFAQSMVVLAIYARPPIMNDFTPKKPIIPPPIAEAIQEITNGFFLGRVIP